MSEREPELLLDHLREQYRRLRKQANGRWLEFYHRSSTAIRFEMEESEEPTLTREGSEDGVAVRLPGGFAAASGCGDKSLSWAIDRAEACSTTAGEQSWLLGGGELRDLDESSEMPSAPELRTWLEKAIDRLPETPLRAWVEAATTIESLVADDGLTASRSRCRAWAMAWVQSGPLIVASRSWRQLPEAGWADLLSDRARSGGGRQLLFTAESSATLVSALVRSVHTDERRIGEPVGPGWNVIDDPRSVTAIYGGSFDDAAFPTERRQLADGERLCGAISGPGHLLRPSFRDPPQPLPAHLTVVPDLVERSGDPFIVSELTIHPLSPAEWALQVGNGLIMSGPAELIRSCVAGIGPPRLSYRGVTTPALLFEGLRVRF